MPDDATSLEFELEPKVTVLELPHAAEMETAQWLVAQVLEQRKVWIAAWHEVVMQPGLVQVTPLPEETVGCSPGSCELRIGERVLARFVVRFREEPIGVEIEADVPTRRWDEAGLVGGSGKTRVSYEEVDGRVDWACEEVGLEGSAGSVEEMMQGLVARYGMRFEFVRV